MLQTGWSDASEAAHKAEESRCVSVWEKVSDIVKRVDRIEGSGERKEDDVSQVSVMQEKQDHVYRDSWRAAAADFLAGKNDDGGVGGGRRLAEAGRRPASNPLPNSENPHYHRLRPAKHSPLLLTWLQFAGRSRLSPQSRVSAPGKINE